MQQLIRTSATAGAFAALCGVMIISARSVGPIWAKGAVRVPVGCEDSKDVREVRAPDDIASVEVRCGGLAQNGRVVLRIRTSGRSPVDLPIELEPGSAWRPGEVLWSPDSRAFLVNGSDSAYAGNDVFVYTLTGNPRAVPNITAGAQRDMVRAFPPCKAAGLDDDDCQRMTNNPQFNMSAVAWTRASSALLVFAEVPCSSMFGGIMCQVMGYELEVPTGRVVARITAPELKRRYQSHLAWEMKIPEKPIWRR
jgi:hypothetical protein